MPLRARPAQRGCRRLGRSGCPIFPASRTLSDWLVTRPQLSVTPATAARRSGGRGSSPTSRDRAVLGAVDCSTPRVVRARWAGTGRGRAASRCAACAQVRGPACSSSSARRRASGRHAALLAWPWPGIPGTLLVAVRDRCVCVPCTPAARASGLRFPMHHATLSLGQRPRSPHAPPHAPGKPPHTPRFGTLPRARSDSKIRSRS